MINHPDYILIHLPGGGVRECHGTAEAEALLPVLAARYGPGITVEAPRPARRLHPSEIRRAEATATGEGTSGTRDVQAGGA